MLLFAPVSQILRKTNTFEKNGDKTRFVHSQTMKLDGRAKRPRFRSVPVQILVESIRDTNASDTSETGSPVGRRVTSVTSSLRAIGVEGVDEGAEVLGVVVAGGPRPPGNGGGGEGGGGMPMNSTAWSSRDFRTVKPWVHGFGKQRMDRQRKTVRRNGLNQIKLTQRACSLFGETNPNQCRLPHGQNSFEARGGLIPWPIFAMYLEGTFPSGAPTALEAGTSPKHPRPNRTGKAVILFSTERDRLPLWGF